MTQHAGESFPKPGEFMGLVYASGNPLYCEVQGNGDYFVVNGKWAFEPDNPPENVKGYRIVLRDMGSMDYNDACQLIEAAADTETPHTGAQQILEALVRDHSSHSQMTKAVKDYNSNFTDHERLTQQVKLRAKYYFRDDIQQPCPEYDLPELAERIHEYFNNIEETQNMTPFEEKGWDKTTRFKVPKDHYSYFQPGDIIYLTRDDGSNNPWFYKESTTNLSWKEDAHCINLKHLKPISTTQSNLTNTKKEAPIMSQTPITIVHSTHVNNQNIDDIDDASVLNLVANAESEIVGLRKIVAKSKKKDARIKEIETSITALIKILDARK